MPPSEILARIQKRKQDLDISVSDRAPQRGFAGHGDSDTRW